ncbi:hypothetical protein L195_g064401, partial [Trifolium pratense]
MSNNMTREKLVSGGCVKIGREKLV